MKHDPSMTTSHAKPKPDVQAVHMARMAELYLKITDSMAPYFARLSFFMNYTISGIISHSDRIYFNFVVSRNHTYKPSEFSLTFAFARKHRSLELIGRKNNSRPNDLYNDQIDDMTTLSIASLQEKLGQVCKELPD